MKNLLTMAEAAELLRVTINAVQVRTIRRAHTLPSVKVGTTVLIKRSDVEKLLRNPSKRGRPLGVRNGQAKGLRFMSRAEYAAATATTTATVTTASASAAT